MINFKVVNNKLKKIIMNKEDYNNIQNLYKASSCFRDALNRVIEEYKLSEDIADKVLSSVLFNYKYLEILEESKDISNKLNIKGLPKKYLDCLNKLYEEQVIIDMYNIEEDFRQELINNGYLENDFCIKLISDDDNLYIISIPFTYGTSEDKRVSNNYICFYDNLVRATDDIMYDKYEFPMLNEFDDDEIDYEASYEEGWIDLDNIDEIINAVESL